MPTYEYKNCRGETREIFGSMKNMPPDYIIVDRRDDSWQEAAAVNEGHEAADIFARQSGGGNIQISVPNHAVSYKGGPPASRSLPRRKVKAPGAKIDKLHGQDVVRHRDGGYTTLDGRPIVQNKADARREMRRTGLDRD